MSEPFAGDFADEIERSRGRINRRLGEIVKRQTSAPDHMREALSYTLLDGGKRLRPLLCLWTHDSLDGERQDACLDVACALECLHSYSLVHDDLPCMDNDDMRRGKPSCHKKFGEAIAVLTGDALLTLCFEVLATVGDRWELEQNAIVDTLRVVTRAAGAGGLITGQALDLSAKSLEPTLDTVDRIHRYKTAALISASMQAGAIVAGAEADVRRRIERAGDLAGGAFQIIDDVLDVQMDGETLGKTPGKDAKDGKLTYPSIAGLEASGNRAAEMIEEAKTELAGAVRGPLVLTLLDFIVARSK